MNLPHHLRILFGVFLIASLPSMTLAQRLSVESMKLDVTDVTGSLAENLVKDNNGNYGGLVRVYLAAPGATFEGSILRQTKHNASEYWLVMAKGYYRLKVVVPGFQPLDINFRDYGITGIEPQRTYVLSISVPQLAQTGPVDDGMRYLTMTVEPKNSLVTVDGTLREVVDGEVSVYLPMRRHTYSVAAPGYATQEGTVDLADNTPTQQVRLVSTRATLRVECPTAGAEVVVGGQRRGTVPWSGSLDAGNYKVEVRLDGYRPQQQSVTLSEKESRTLTFPALQQIVGSLNVNYRPLGSEVLVDGRRVGTTPNVFRDIPVGQRRVEIRKEGYQPFSQTVSIKENEQTDLTGSLTAITTASSGNAGSSANTGLSGQSRETFTVNGVSFTMIRVDGGTFMMGASKDQDSDAYDNESPVHEVTLSTYMMGETEVTQALWQAVMGSNPSEFKGDLSRPVECVSWKDCQKFLKKLNALTGKTFRLPTEAEWEYAARGGSKSRKTKYSGGNDIGSVAWYRINAYDAGPSSPDYGTHPVKGKAPNELGIYDMSGNVWEWCSDWYGPYSAAAQTNPKGASSGSSRVFRGGSWRSGSWRHSAGDCRVSYRFRNTPGTRGSGLGLRLAL